MGLERIRTDRVAGGGEVRRSRPVLNRLSRSRGMPFYRRRRLYIGQGKNPGRSRFEPPSAGDEEAPRRTTDVDDDRVNDSFRARDTALGARRFANRPRTSPFTFHLPPAAPDNTLGIHNAAGQDSHDILGGSPGRSFDRRSGL